LYSVFSIPVAVIALSFFLISKIKTKPVGNKKMADVSKLTSDEIKSKQIKNIKDFSLVAVVLLTAIMYAFGWQAASCFFAGSIVFVLVDYFLLNLSNSVTTRLAEAGKGSLAEIHQLNFNFSFASNLLIFAVGFLLLVATHYLFKDPTLLLVFALSAVLVDVFSLRTTKKYFSLYLAALAVILFLPENDLLSGNAEIFLLAFSAFILLLSLLSGLFSRVNLKTENLSAVFYRTSIFIIFIFFAGAYFGPKYILQPADTVALLKLIGALISGALVSIMLVFTNKFTKIAPIIAAAIVILVSNYLAGTFGLSLSIIGFLALLPLVSIIDSYRQQGEKVLSLAVSAEMSDQTKENCKKIISKRLDLGGFVDSLFGVAAASFVLLYFSRFTGVDFLATDPRLFSGLLLGFSLFYFLAVEIADNKLLKLTAAVFSLVIAGVTLGPIFLAGVLIGAVAIELIINKKNTAQTLTVLIIGILLSGFIENQLNLTIRMIIFGSVVFLTFAYFVIEKIYGKRIEAEK